MEAALIGNCSYQALIDRFGRVSWLCWPRFDSSFVFGAMLDKERGGEFTVAPPEGEIAAQQEYINNTNVLRTVFETKDGSFEVVDCAPRYRDGRLFQRPDALVRRIRPLSGKPKVRVVCTPTYDYGRATLHCGGVSNMLVWEHEDFSLQLNATVSTETLHSGNPFELNGDVYLLLSWGWYPSEPLAQTCESLIERTIDYWHDWVRPMVVPELLHDACIRSALALKLHQFQETGAITPSATTSISEHPHSGRTWDYRYCWPRDAYFTVDALYRLGKYDELSRFATFLANLISRDKPLQPAFDVHGQEELHEVVLDHLSGHNGDGPVRVGNAAYLQKQHDVYGEVMAALAPIYLDPRYEKHAVNQDLDIVRWLLSRMEEVIGQPDAGIWEKRDVPRVYSFTSLSHWMGANIAARIGRLRGAADLCERGLALAAKASGLIEDCWDTKRNYYADTAGNHHADASTLMLVNLGYLDSRPERAHAHVKELSRQLCQTDSLLHRYVHNDGLGETKAAFLVCGFWHAQALGRLGRIDEARRATTALAGYANHVGLFSEDIDPETGAQWGNFPQTYSHVGLIDAASSVEHLAARVDGVAS